ncbi:MAG: response regulator, partial [Verrucomicrobia bacterium]|nr:response regulator [Verrucomicrobiota bacterium]
MGQSARRGLRAGFRGNPAESAPEGEGPGDRDSGGRAADSDEPGVHDAPGIRIAEPAARDSGTHHQPEVTAWRGRAHVRLMKPLVTVASCLRCHREHGYREGDIRGGISVAVPMAHFGPAGSSHTLALAHGGLWLLGLAGMGTGWNKIRRHMRERDEANDRLRLAKEEAEVANQAKSAFLATMSHEIRTPLNGVIGMTGLLLDSPMTREQRRYAEVVRASADSLLDIINDILDFSKIEAGRLELENIPFDLRELAEEAAELMAIRAYEKRLEFATLIEHEVPTNVAGDPTRLRQILINLAGNAIKFTAEGEVLLRVTREQETSTRVVVRFAVSDTGVGIPADRMDRLFKSFSQVDAATTRRFGGTGLGLAICKRLVEAMQGRIGVESQPGKGSTFWFTVSLEKRGAERRSAPEALAALRSCRFLIVDDNPTNRLVLREQLRSWDCACAEASGPQEALTLLGEAQAAGQPFQVALLDMEMPEMDGVMLGRKIREDARLQATRLVLLTSCARPGDGKLAQEAGFSAYLTKPAKQAHLRDCLVQAVGYRSPEAPAAELPAAPRALGNARILLAEDN